MDAREAAVSVADKNLALAVFGTKQVAQPAPWNLLICMLLAISTTPILICFQNFVLCWAILISWLTSWDGLYNFLIWTPDLYFTNTLGWWHRSVAGFNTSVYMSIFIMFFDALNSWFGIMVYPTPELFELMGVVMACLGAPLLEELQFRGPILWAIKKKVAPRVLWSMIVVLGFLFTIGHAIPLYGYINIAGCVVVSTWLLFRFRSLWPCIAFHAAHNIICTLW